MVLLVALHLLAASHALVHVVVDIRVAESHLGLQVPVAVEYPGIAVGDAASHEPALEAVVGHAPETGAQHLKAVGEVPPVELARMAVHAEEVPVHALAKPVAQLGLEHPVLPLAAARHVPGVPVAREVGTPAGSEPHLCTRIHREGRIIKQVTLYGYILPFRGEAGHQTDKEYCTKSCFHIVSVLFAVILMGSSVTCRHKQSYSLAQHDAEREILLVATPCSGRESGLLIYYLIVHRCVSSRFATSVASCFRHRCSRFCVSLVVFARIQVSLLYISSVFPLACLSSIPNFPLKHRSSISTTSNYDFRHNLLVRDYA